MSVIKSVASTQSPHVRAFDLRAPDPEPSPLLLELERLRIALSAAEAREADLQDKIAARDEVEARAREAARAEGRTEGRALADTRHAEQLARLSASAGAAETAFATQLASIERLAAGFAGEALARITGDPERHADLVASAVAQELKGVAASTVVAVEVSKLDFPNADALAEITRRSGLGVSVVEAVGSVSSGGCRIRLKLGEVDLSLHSQTERLRRILDAHADGVA